MNPHTHDAHRQADEESAAWHAAHARSLATAMLVPLIQSRLRDEYRLEDVPDSFVEHVVDREWRKKWLAADLAFIVANDWQRGLRTPATS